MRAKYADLNTKWEVMDVRDLKLEDASVDVAIDKGTLDAFLHGSLWDPPEDVRESVGKYVNEVCILSACVLYPVLSDSDNGNRLRECSSQEHNGFTSPIVSRTS